MFNVEINEQSSKTDKLLYNIFELLQQTAKVDSVEQPQTEKPKASNAELPLKPKTADKANLDGMTRKELIAMIKKLPKGSIKGKWMTFDDNTLRKEIGKVI